MRDFKFRAWDKLDGMIYFCFDDLYYNRVAIDHGVYELPIMQYTGVEDERGKEVWEGDICEGEHAVYLILWDLDKAQYRAKIIKTKSVLTKNCSFPLWQYVEGAGKCRFNVIGNIYESKGYSDLSFCMV